MPEEGLFVEGTHQCRSEAYYSVLFHELGHWSGAEARLNRQLGYSFGSPEYALEELVAELTSAFLCAELQFSPAASRPRALHRELAQGPEIRQAGGLYRRRAGLEAAAFIQAKPSS